MFFKVNITGFESIVAKEHIDAKNLAQSNLRISNGSVEHIAPDPSQATDDTTGDTPNPTSPNLVRLVNELLQTLQLS